METVQIYVALPDEAVPVWQPVAAIHLHHNVHRIAEQPYDREEERWEFGPGEEILCEMIETEDGKILAASGRAR